MSSLDPKLLCIGRATLDILHRVEEQPRPDQKSFSEESLLCGGGPAATAACTAAKLNCPTAFAGYLGHDLAGDLHLQEFKAFNVQTQYLQRGKEPTSIASSWATPDGHRTLISSKHTQPLISGCESITKSITHLLCDGWESDLSLKVLHSNPSLYLILDAGSWHSGTQSLLPHTQDCIASEKFARQYSNSNDPRNALDSLKKLCPRVVITLGQKGLLWAEGETTGELPSFSVSTVDSLGAGDVFHGAYAAFLLQGIPFLECLQKASAAAAMSCTQLGGRPGIPTVPELEKFMSCNS